MGVGAKTTFQLSQQLLSVLEYLKDLVCHNMKEKELLTTSSQHVIVLRITLVSMFLTSYFLPPLVKYL